MSTNSNNSNNGNSSNNGDYQELGGPQINSVSVTYCQTGDAYDQDDWQYLTIKTDDGGADKFFVLETKRWAFDDIKELIQILEDFMNRCDDYEAS